MDYAKGSPSIKAVKPYGLLAARSTSAFLSIPSEKLALTFAALYQTVRTEENMFKTWLKASRPNITDPWPRGMMKRFASLQLQFSTHRKAIFQAYEDKGGDFMGVEPEVTTARTRTVTRVTDFEEDF